MHLIFSLLLSAVLFNNKNKEKVKSGEYTVVGKGNNRKLRDNKTGMYIVT